MHPSSLIRHDADGGVSANTTKRAEPSVLRADPMALSHALPASTAHTYFYLIPP
jgi:hypothetical protein